MAHMTPGDVRSRAETARKFLEVTQLIDVAEDKSFRPLCDSLAIMAGIATGDAICGHVLTQRSRGQDHHQAVDLLRRVRGADSAARAMSTLLDIKDAADGLPAERTARALRAAQRLVEQMELFLRT